MVSTVTEGSLAGDLSVDDAGIVPAVLGDEGEVLDLGRNVRLFTRAQRIALLERDGGCSQIHAPPEHCEAHHIRWWETAAATFPREQLVHAPVR